MLSDRAKLLMLAISMLACLGTLITSPSISMGNAAMRVLSAPVRKHCMAPRKAANKCSTEAKTPCTDLDKVVTKCERVAKRAYQHINLGGCPFEIKAVTLCEAEWCHSGGLDGSACQRECANAKESLTTCIERQVSSFFRRNRLKIDGTLENM
jgi:hypothetical protein